MIYRIYSLTQKGDEGSQVIQLQRSLPLWAAPEPLAADGIFGGKTESAVKAYQSAMELPVDGIVGRTTGSALGLWVDAERGFDASHWQDISWDKYIPGEFAFSIFKATQGASFVDPEFSRNVEQAFIRGLDVGAYHFADLAFSPADEAFNFCAEVKGKPISSAFLDLEAISAEPAFDYRAWIESFLNIVRVSLPKEIEIGIYTSSRYLREISAQDFDYIRQFKLWGVNWSRQPMVAPWNSWDYWQYTSKGRVPWVAGDLDLNLRVKRG
jgi:lysozyme